MHGFLIKSWWEWIARLRALGVHMFPSGIQMQIVPPRFLRSYPFQDSSAVISVILCFESHRDANFNWAFYVLAVNGINSLESLLFRNPHIPPASSNISDEAV